MTEDSPVTHYTGFTHTKNTVAQHPGFAGLLRAVALLIIFDRMAITGEEGKIAALFDGTEKVVSWDVFPWYIGTVSTP